MANNVDELVKSLKKKITVYQTNTPENRRLIFRIGMILRHESQIAYSKSGLKRRTGTLANSLWPRYKFRGEKTEILFGAWGVRYAAVHEFGGRDGKPIARPYLGPTLQAARPRIRKAIMEARR